jgi:hypothetical protein
MANPVGWPPGWVFSQSLSLRLPRVQSLSLIGSGHVGRSSSAHDPVQLAVLAYARHNHTAYESCLGDRDEYPELKRDFNTKAGEIIDGWRGRTLDDE